MIISDVLWDRTKRKNQTNFPPQYWIPDLPIEYINAWETLNDKGKDYYQKVALPYYEKRYKGIKKHNKTV